MRNNPSRGSQPSSWGATSETPGIQKTSAGTQCIGRRRCNRGWGSSKVVVFPVVLCCFRRGQYLVVCERCVRTRVYCQSAGGSRVTLGGTSAAMSPSADGHSSDEGATRHGDRGGFLLERHDSTTIHRSMARTTIDSTDGWRARLGTCRSRLRSVGGRPQQNELVAVARACVGRYPHLTIGGFPMPSWTAAELRRPCRCR